LTHFFESRWFNEVGIILSPFAAISTEAVIADNKLLPNENKKFLQEGNKMLFLLVWLMVSISPKSEIKFNEETVPKDKIDQVESALNIFVAKVESWDDGLAKFAGLMSKFLRCSPSQGLELLQAASHQARLLQNLDFPEFSSKLFIEIGNAFISIKRYEKAFILFDEVIKIYPRNYASWNRAGASLDYLERYEEALNYFQEAINIDPNKPLAWVNMGVSLGHLKRDKEALTYVKKAIDIAPEQGVVWNLQGICLTRIEQYEDAMQSFDRAIELDTEEKGYLLNKGILLAWMRKYQEGIDLCISVLEDIKYYVKALYGLACCYSLKNNIEEAVSYLEQAITQEPEEIKKRAQKDPEFDGIREDSRFQSLIH